MHANECVATCDQPPPVCGRLTSDPGNYTGVVWSETKGGVGSGGGGGLVTGHLGSGGAGARWGAKAGQQPLSKLFLNKDKNSVSFIVLC